MKTVAIIQARMGSTRLPGKVLKKLGDKTVLNHVIDRAKSAGIEVVVATSDEAQDDLIAQEAKKCGVPAFRGSESDVLSRYYGAAVENKADLIVRITSDCPLYDGQLLKQMLAARKDEDYYSNATTRTFPRGLDTEIFTFQALEKAHRAAKLQPEREHVTAYIYNHPEEFKIGAYTQTPDLSHMRWTLDTEEDWQMISAVYNALYKGTIFSTKEVLEYLSNNPQVAELNAHIEQKK